MLKPRTCCLGLPLMAGYCLVASLTSVAAATAPSGKLPPQANRKVDFLQDIRPIFAATCYECHGPEKQKSGLRLDQKAPALKGGDIGPLLVPGHSEESLLLQAVTGTKENLAQMPKKREPLTPAQIGLLRAWIDQGADWPETTVAKARDPRKHWAFTPPVRPKVPVVGNRRWVRNPVDAFILARLEKEKLKPSPEADKVTLLRRLSLDLIGLPPSIPEVDAFLTDKGPNAYEKQVERLLYSSHYG